MLRVWSHAVTLLLGITLAVGFYEGRRLVTEHDARAGDRRRAGRARGPSRTRCARPDRAPASRGQTRPDDRPESEPHGSHDGTAHGGAPVAEEPSPPASPGEPSESGRQAEGRSAEDGQLPLALPVAPAEDTGEPQP
jgi:hypothetical protein